MKKNISVIAVFVACSITLVSCTSIKIDSSNNSNNTATDTTKNESEQMNDSKIEIDTAQRELLNNIYSEAQAGKIIDYSYGVETAVIEEIIKEWGNADSEEYVEEAKGRYYTFESRGVVFGCNKGSQVFEVRSFADKLKEISYNDVLNFFEKPHYDVTTANNERIIGYAVNSHYKLEFVFKNADKDNPVVDHYCVLWPAGTVNLMSDDPGREW